MTTPLRALRLPDGATAGTPMPVQARSLGAAQRETLRRLSGHWLLLEHRQHIYWATVEGRLVPPYQAVRPSLVESLRDGGMLQTVQRAGRRGYTISFAGRQALHGCGQAVLPFPAGVRPSPVVDARATA
jgi:hypothetical protein